ncbi:MAG: class I SAM-dependent methyltransferase [Chloroflexi bacterium]|nr:class I SAM-dependent methyltransferase [Chloroflexota bacterium]
MTSAPAAPFTCLWCGSVHTPRSADDLEAWARLCADCLGRADENEFLRFRLRQALDARGRASAGDLDAELVRYYEARAGEYDDWYLRRGRYEHGPIHDQAWAAELDAAGRWLDSLPLGGDIVELAAGTGWWSTLLASKGTLSAYDAAGAPLDRARDRLLAHGLRAHLHVRDAWAEPERAVDALFTGFWLSHVPRQRLGAFLALARRWLRPAGRFAAIDSLPDPQSGAGDTEWLDDDVQRRSLADGRQFRVRKVTYLPDELAAALAAASFHEVEVSTTGRFFVLVTATA